MHQVVIAGRQPILLPSRSGCSSRRHSKEPLMDESQFDALSRAVATGHSRRRLTRLLGGLALSGPLLLGGGIGISAKHKHHKKHKHHAPTAPPSPPPPPPPPIDPCQGLKANGSSCTQSSECCSGNCFNALCAERVLSCAGTPCTPPANGCAGTTCCGDPAFFSAGSSCCTSLAIFPCGNFCCAPPATACCGTICCA